MHKCIFQGKLNFKDARSYNKALEQYENRAEVFFKNEVVFKAEEVFDDEDHSMLIPRKVINIPMKNWRNTLDIFNYIRQFALSGQVECWMVESGKILEYERFEPKGDKAVILNYKTGRDLSDQEGQEAKAIQHLTQAIDKYEKHSQAYERRGYVNIRMKNYQDARYDFDKSIRLDGFNAKAFYGRGRLNMLEERWEEAVHDFDHACKKSLAVEPLFWVARRKKAVAHLELKQFDLAAKELSLLVKRNFAEGDPSYNYIPEIHTMYVKTLISLGEEHEALEFIEGNLNNSNVQNPTRRRSWITDRGVVRKLLGQKGYKKDWEEAAALGEPRANQLLAEQD